jgi:hypothetical protein
MLVGKSYVKMLGRTIGFDNLVFSGTTNPIGFARLWTRLAYSLLILFTA